jgi:nucleoside-diphosphate-sugar epimerase
MIGSRLVDQLVKEGSVSGKPIRSLDLHDRVAPIARSLPGGEVTAYSGDLSAPEACVDLISHRPDLIFHLAGIVSGEAEVDFELGYRVNLDGTRSLFEAIRMSGNRPRLVFTSSIAVFGGPFPDTVPDDFHLTPHSSYGTQKLVGEVLLADYTRRDILDGVGIRLPTICVRPGKPNRAASGFFSNIIREPLNGISATVPVPRSVVHTHASPRSAVRFLLHAATIDGAAVGPRRNLSMPGVAVTVAEQIEALGRVAGEEAAALVSDAPDAAVWAIVQTWPGRIAATRARDLGFEAENSFDDIIAAHIADESLQPKPALT